MKSHQRWQVWKPWAQNTRVQKNSLTIWGKNWDNSLPHTWHNLTRTLPSVCITRATKFSQHRNLKRYVSSSASTLVMSESQLRFKINGLFFPLRHFLLTFFSFCFFAVFSPNFPFFVFFFNLFSLPPLIFSTSFFALQSMTVQSEEARNLVTSLRRVLSSEDSFSGVLCGRSMANILYGLQGNPSQLTPDLWHFHQDMSQLNPNLLEMTCSFHGSEDECVRVLLRTLLTKVISFWFTHVISLKWFTTDLHM